MMLKILLFFCSFLICSSSSTISDGVYILFQNQHCIPGNWDTLSKETVAKTDTDTTIKNTNTKIESAGDEKSAITLINELAQFNELDYSFELINEEGPPHNKTFTVRLYLGDETYTNEGKSLKKAQQLTADTALKGTKYIHPPVKLKESHRTLTPTVLLNNLAAKLGLSVSYMLVTDDILDLNGKNDDVQFMPKKSYLQKLNESIHLNNSLNVIKDGGDISGPFTVKVDVSGNSFFGKAHTIQNAKHDAAQNALKSLKQNQGTFQCLKEDDNCKSNKQRIKSAISQVYEAAQLRNLPVAFEVVDEIGPSHKKKFTTKCVVGDLEATGEGSSKKESKRYAAENILPSLLELPVVSGKRMESSEAQKGQRSKRKNKKNKVIKTTFDKIDRLFDNVVDFGKGLVDNIVRHKQESSNDDTLNKKDDQRRPRKSPTDEIIQLGKFLDLNLKFNDFTTDEGGKHYTVLDLGSKPSFVCLGEGINQKNARDLAATYGIQKLYTLGLLNNLLDKSKDISEVLDKEEYYSHFWLEVVESNEKEL